jgi:hypothetical protein
VLFINLEVLKDVESHLGSMLEVSAKLVADVKKNAKVAGLHSDQTVKAASALNSNLRDLRLQKEKIGRIVTHFEEKTTFITKNMIKLNELYNEADTVGAKAYEERLLKPQEICKTFHPKVNGKWRHKCGCA